MGPPGATGQRPLVIAHANGHLLTVNSAMLTCAGLDADSEIEGVIKFGPGPLAGQPTGELQEPAAMYPVLRLASTQGLSASINDAGLHNFGRIACQQGVTTATDLVNRLRPPELEVLDRHARDASFPVRLVPVFQAFHRPKAAAEGAALVSDLKARARAVRWARPGARALACGWHWPCLRCRRW